MSARAIGILSSVAFVALIGALLFGCAGRWDPPMFWAYLGVWTASALVGPLVVDPTLIKERLQPGPGGKDYAITIAFLPLWLGQYVVAGLDVGRFHWSATVPLVVQVVALLAMAAALAVDGLGDGGQSLLFVGDPHPGRPGTPPGHERPVRLRAAPGLRGLAVPPHRRWTGAGLLAALLGLLMVLPVLRRTAQEDRVLREQLEGYAAYAEEVRYRLFPGVW